MRKTEERLKDILQAIEAIERYAVRGRDAFDTEELFRYGYYIIYKLLERLLMLYLMS